MTQDLDSLHKLLDDFGQEPQQDLLNKLLEGLYSHLDERPPCPKCDSTMVNKFGTNARKGERTQQFRCGFCKHVYSWRSLHSRDFRSNYPPCLNCGGEVVKRGFWRWENKDGTLQKAQKYQCKTCGGYFRLEKKRGSSEISKPSGNMHNMESHSEGKGEK